MGFKHMLLFVLFLAVMVMGQSGLANEIRFGPLQFRATVGSMSSSAAYVSITNHGDTADRLVGVTSKLARKTELHKMEMDNGVMKMRQVEGGIDLLAGRTIHLAPGGHHVMLVGLTAPLSAGNIFEITLVFERAGEKTLKGMAMTPADLDIGDASKMHKHKRKTH